MSYMTVQQQGGRYVAVPPADTLSVKDLAAMLGWSLRTTYVRLRDGSIPARQVGSRWVISRRRITAWLHGEDA